MEYKREKKDTGSFVTRSHPKRPFVKTYFARYLICLSMFLFDAMQMNFRVFYRVARYDARE